MHQQTLSRRRALALCALALAGALVPRRPGPAAAQGGPAAFLEDLGNRAVAMLSDPALPESQRQQNFRKLMQESFDLPAIAQFILGRYWRQASEAERAEFIEVFQEVMAARFAPYFAGKSEESFAIVGPVEGAGADGRRSIRSMIRLEGGKLAQVDWQLVERGDAFQIVDVVTEGVSMALTLRSEYGSVLSRSGGDVGRLIQLLRDRARSA